MINNINIDSTSQWMVVVNWLLARKVESVGYMDSTSQWVVVVNWLLARKVESVGYLDSTSQWVVVVTFLASSQLTTTIHWLVLSMFMLLIIFVIVCGLFWVEANLCRFLSFVYICTAIGDLVIKRGGIGIPLTGLTQSYFCACPKSKPVHPTSYVMVFVFRELRWKVIVCFVDIGGTVDHHFFKMFFSWIQTDFCKC
jgi:hypothetical protein